MEGSTSLIHLKGIGEKTQKLFEKLNLFTLDDLLGAYPRDYDTFKEPVSIQEACPGETCAIYAAVREYPKEKRVRNLSILTVTVADNTASMSLTFFNMSFLKKVLKPGGYYLFRGIVQSRGNLKKMEQPRLFKLEEYKLSLIHI